MKPFRRNALKRAIQNRIKKHIGSVNSFIGNEGINHLPILVEELSDYFYEKLNWLKSQSTKIEWLSQCDCKKWVKHDGKHENVKCICGKYPDVFSPHRKHKKLL